MGRLECWCPLVNCRGKADIKAGVATGARLAYPVAMSTTKSRRMEFVDILVMCGNLRKNLVGLRCANVYDVAGNSKLFLIKLAGANTKKLLLIESGSRIHTTEFMREKLTHPSGFALKVTLLVHGFDSILRFLINIGQKTHSYEAAGTSPAARS